jgi:hypothetical protein
MLTAIVAKCHIAVMAIRHHRHKEIKVSRDDPRVLVRLPVDLKAWLASTAVMNRRSQTAEIVFRLEAARAAEQAGRATGATTAGQASQA